MVKNFVPIPNQLSCWYSEYEYLAPTIQKFVLTNISWSNEDHAPDEHICTKISSKSSELSNFICSKVLTNNLISQGIFLADSAQSQMIIQYKSQWSIELCIRFFLIKVPSHDQCTLSFHHFILNWGDGSVSAKTNRRLA